eukprot:CAMPEP_0113854660 /NCGR_PEP_ID=MMETSP0372-20130328/7547_1 /TAXON_ID=340204 /ORGANISM="Lankesteria abbotti" /LENGTH=49 /DNA_ID=CAMNT_0000828061 /DNA_START=122 /DNA_END=271 /DNA_ORIENTATION=- /assembly_acc=CAM_ASM_000359
MTHHNEVLKFALRGIRNFKRKDLIRMREVADLEVKIEDKRKRACVKEVF